MKILIEIDETFPYSEYYRLNGQLGIEFYKTKRPVPTKRIKLAKEGIPLFEAKARFPKSTKIYLPDEFVSLEQIRGIAEKVREVYQERNYKLYGTFDKYHLKALVFLDDNERKYKTLKSYEDQCRELQAEITQLENCFSQKNEKVNQLREEIEQAEDRLWRYCEKEEYYKKLEKDNEFLKQEKAQLQSDCQQLTEQSQHLREERDVAKEETQMLKNRTWWQRLFDRY